MNSIILLSIYVLGGLSILLFGLAEIAHREEQIRLKWLGLSENTKLRIQIVLGVASMVFVSYLSNAEW